MTVTADVPVAEPQYLQPAELPEAPKRDLVIRSGALTIKPDQTSFTADQRAGLSAIGITPDFDPAQVKAFLHIAQVRGLDPWARQLYLIRRGKGENTKYTMQTGIDAFRMLAVNTGRFICNVGEFWTGDDDDETSWRLVHEDGIDVFRRVWRDAWLDRRGHPAIARFVIEYYAKNGQVVRGVGQANWQMFAPYHEEWGYQRGERTKSRLRDADGNPIMKLNEMWAKGGPLMLSKCAESLALRRAFPETLSGVYTSEEMQQADAEDRRRRQQEKAQRRTEEYQAAQATRVSVVDSTVVEESAPDLAGAEPATEQPTGQQTDPTSRPLTDADWSDVKVAQPPPTPDRETVLAELTCWGHLWDVDLRTYLRRPLAARNETEVTALSDSELRAWLARQRNSVVKQLIKMERPADAEAVNANEWLHTRTDS